MRDETSNLLAELRTVIKDPMFSGSVPDLEELRAAIDHAPRLVEQFVQLYGIHRTTLERIMRQGSGGMPKACWPPPAEAVIHDFFRDHSNYFHSLEVAAEQLRAAEACDTDDIYAVLKARLARHARHHGETKARRGDDAGAARL